MKNNLFERFRQETENEIRRQVNKGLGPKELQDWLLNKLVSTGTAPFTGRQIGILFDLIP